MFFRCIQNSLSLSAFPPEINTSTKYVPLIKNILIKYILSSLEGRSEDHKVTWTDGLAYPILQFWGEEQQVRQGLKDRHDSMVG